MAAGGHGFVDQVQALPCIFAAHELGADIAHHVKQVTSGEWRAESGKREITTKVGGYCQTFLYARFLDVLMFGIAAVEVLVTLDHMVLSPQPTVEALLAAVALPHGQKG